MSWQKKFFVDLLFLTLILILILVSACGCSVSTPSVSTPASSASKPPVTTSPSTASATVPAPRTGGVLKIIQKPGITNLGVPSVIRTQGDGVCSRPALESLVGVNEKGDFIPQLATGWQFSSDYSALTFNLRKGVKFHDGTDFNAQAVKYCLDAFKTGKRNTLQSVTSIDVVDDYTVKLGFSQYSPSFLSSFCNDYAATMASPAALQKLGNSAMLNPVGTGPFKFVSYVADTTLKYEKFDGYWQKGKPYLDGIEINFIADASTALMSFKNGEAQIHAWATTKDASALQSSSKYNIVPLYGGVNGLIGDGAHSDSPFSNLKVRQAVSYAIDNEAIAKAIGYGFFRSANQFSTLGHYSYNPSVTGYPYNPQKAKQLLAEAGYSSGFKTTIYSRNEPDHVTVNTAVQDYLKNVGIDASMNVGTTASIQEFQTKGWQNGLILFQFALPPDPGAILRSNLSSTATTYTPRSVYIPDDYNSKLLQADQERDSQKRQDMFKELSKTITDQYCLAIPVYVIAGVTIYTSEIHDLDLNKYSSREWLPENVWLSK
jgi:peptide/nickel transport system substrate-binding protein